MNDTEFSYQIIRSARKTIAIQIRPDGGIIVRCPNRMTAAQVHAFVLSRAGWIRSHLPNQPPGVLPPFTREELRTLANQACKEIPARVAHFAPLVGVTWGRITIRSQRSRWGSCSGRGNLNFNCLLMLMPSEVVDYVVVHELCHRLEMNHSRKFWAHVERILPDYKTSLRWLKENGSALIARLPQN